MGGSFGMAEAKDDASKANPPVQQSAPAAPPDTAARLLAEEKAKALREAEEQRVRTIQEEEERRRASFGVYFETVLLEPMRREMMQKHARQVAISLKDRTGVSQCVNDETSCRRSIVWKERDAFAALVEAEEMQTAFLRACTARRKPSFLAQLAKVNVKNDEEDANETGPGSGRKWVLRRQIAARQIQCCWRRSVAAFERRFRTLRRDYLLEQRIRTQSATRIQSVYRRSCAKKRVEVLRQDHLKAVRARGGQAVPNTDMFADSTRK